MKNFFKKIIQIFLSAGVLLALIIFLSGYKEYKNIIDEDPLEIKVKKLVESDFANYEAIDDFFIQAIVVTEDQRFFERSSAVDLRGLIRALATNLKEMKLVEGGSTIPQQLAKNLYFTHEASAQRKVAEYFIARDIVKIYNKEEIFSLYANIIYYGDGYYGISEASFGYFNKSPSELSPFESSLLAGLPQAPSAYQLSDHFDLARKRQKHVLNRMVEKKMISEQEALKIFNGGE